MPVVDFIPYFRSLAAAIPGAYLQHGGREGGREGEEKEGSLNEISVLTPLCS